MTLRVLFALFASSGASIALADPAAPAGVGRHAVAEEDVRSMLSLFAQLGKSRKDPDARMDAPTFQSRLSALPVRAQFTLQQALEATCVTPAWLSGDEHVRGRLLPGLLADLVVLDQDPYELEPEALPEIRVVATMVGGRLSQSAVEPLAH